MGQRLGHDNNKNSSHWACCCWCVSSHAPSPPTCPSFFLLFLCYLSTSSPEKAPRDMVLASPILVKTASRPSLRCHLSLDTQSRGVPNGSSSGTGVHQIWLSSPDSGNPVLGVMCFLQHSARPTHNPRPLPFSQTLDLPVLVSSMFVFSLSCKGK